MPVLSRRRMLTSRGLILPTVTVFSDPPPTVPDDPSSLTATAISGSQINLSWQDNSDNEDNFEIEESTAGAGGPFSNVDTVGMNVTSYQRTGLDSATQYWYQVRATNTTGNSGYSNVATDTTSSFPSAESGPRYINQGATGQTFNPLEDRDYNYLLSGIVFFDGGSGGGNLWDQINKITYYSTAGNALAALVPSLDLTNYSAPTNGTLKTTGSIITKDAYVGNTFEIALPNVAQYFESTSPITIPNSTYFGMGFNGGVTYGSAQGSLELYFALVADDLSETLETVLTGTAAVSTFGMGHVTNTGYFNWRVTHSSGTTSYYIRLGVRNSTGISSGTARFSYPRIGTALSKGCWFGWKGVLASAPNQTNHYEFNITGASRARESRITRSIFIMPVGAWGVACDGIGSTSSLDQTIDNCDVTIRGLARGIIQEDGSGASITGPNVIIRHQGHDVNSREDLDGQAGRVINGGDHSFELINYPHVGALIEGGEADVDLHDFYIHDQTTPSSYSLPTNSFAVMLFTGVNGFGQDRLYKIRDGTIARTNNGLHISQSATLFSSTTIVDNVQLVDLTQVPRSPEYSGYDIHGLKLFECEGIRRVSFSNVTGNGILNATAAAEHYAKGLKADLQWMSGAAGEEFTVTNFDIRLTRAGDPGQCFPFALRRVTTAIASKVSITDCTWGAPGGGSDVSAFCGIKDIEVDALRLIRPTWVETMGFSDQLDLVRVELGASSVIDFWIVDSIFDDVRAEYVYDNWNHLKLYNGSTATGSSVITAWSKTIQLENAGSGVSVTIKDQFNNDISGSPFTTDGAGQVVFSTASPLKHYTVAGSTRTDLTPYSISASGYTTTSLTTADLKDFTATKLVPEL